MCWRHGVSLVQYFDNVCAGSCGGRGFHAAYDCFFDSTAVASRRNNITFVGWDFNMALFVVGKELRARGIEVVFLGSYVWREHDSTLGGGGRAGFEGARFDSLGMFSVKGVARVTRFITLPIIEGTDDDKKLHEFKSAQGYPSSSYLGGQEAIEGTFAEHVLTHVDGAVEEPLPCTRQKVISPEVWGAPNHLAERGAHMPLLFFVGERGHRSDEALTRREGRRSGGGT